MYEDGGIQVYSGILLSHKKNKTMPFTVNMDGPRDYHPKGSKSDRERVILYISHIWNLKNDTNELIYKIETDSQI